jgi:hypothetical protein
MGAMVNLLIGITIAFLPLFIKVSSVDLTRTSRDNLLVVILAVLGFMLTDKKRKLPKSLYVAFSYGLLCLIINQWQPASVVVMFHVFYAVSGIVFFASYYEKHSEEGRDYVLNGMVAGALIQSIITIANYFQIPLWFYFIRVFYPHVTGFNIASVGIGSLGNSNILAAYVALTSIAFFRKKIIYLIPLPLIALYLAGSVMGYATLLAGTAYYFNFKLNLVKKYWLYYSALVFMALAFFVGVKGHDSERFSAWREIFSRMDIGHFLFGKGPGWFANHPVLVHITREKLVQEHNAFLTVLNMFGIIAFVLLVPVFIKFLGAKDKNPIFPSILFAAFVNSYGNFSLHQSSVALIIIVTAAICIAEGNNNGINMEWERT